MTSRASLSTLPLLAALLFSSSAFALETTIAPEELPDFENAFGPGYGYHPELRQFGLFQCAKGETLDAVVDVPTAPFATPEFVVLRERAEVKVIFKAETSNRRVLTLKSDGKIASFPNPNKEAVCGSQYVSEMQVGVKLVVAKTFNVAGDDQVKLVSILKSRVTDLRSFATYRGINPTV